MANTPDIQTVNISRQSFQVKKDKVSARKDKRKKVSHQTRSKDTEPANYQKNYKKYLQFQKGNLKNDQSSIERSIILGMNSDSSIDISQMTSLQK